MKTHASSEAPTSLASRPPTDAQRAARRTRLVLWSGITLVVVAALGYSFRPVPVWVDLADVTRGPLVVTLDEEAETRVRDVHVLSAPVAGRVLRIEAEAGDEVRAGETVLAQIEPVDPAFLDLRTEAQAHAAVRAAEAALEHSQAQLAQSLAEAEFARGEFRRMQRLVERNSVSERDFDNARRADKTSVAATQTARAAVHMRESELERAQAELLSPAAAQARRGECDCVPVHSPVSGKVLRVLHESEGVVAPGEALLEIGDPLQLEVRAEYLSTEAVALEPGLDVQIVGWGGEKPLGGTVRRIEPYGFTEVSALGIEEQRVNVLIDPDDSPAWARLGHGFSVEARTIVWQAEDVVKIPATALFRRGDAWAVFVQDENHASERIVSVGRRTAREVQVTEGLTAGERVVAYPSDRVADGTRIAARPAA